jgi:hypothetical protein
LFVIGSYYLKTNFDFPNFQQRAEGELEAEFGDISGFSLISITSEVINTTNTTVDGERREWDTAVGWYVHPYVTFLVGYKEINIETAGIIDITFEFPDFPEQLRLSSADSGDLFCNHLFEMLDVLAVGSRRRSAR